ncbi:hypothetical protein [Pseudomonas fitomaticsae]|uniref:Uncharacterized protein n=1 Tax=Pseudomonas fitomaticsae TaxID=2837969 RepID=A0ABY3PUG0_9PSED|nr:hypothetical protein [Pseudomonas fitomaticsae]UFP97450.1 hypothetical protein KJY40_15335 [Pseudomonas fitomaticsae]
MASADTPQLPTKCIAVRDSGLFESRPTDKKDAPLRTGESNSDPACANLGSDARPLVGTGDLIIAVDKTAFTALKTSQGALSGAFVLYLNGIPLPGDAMLIASETVDQYVQLRFRIRQGPETQRLWSMLYADGALFEPTALYPALGWSSNDATQTLIPLRGQATSVSITTGARLVLALLLVVLAIAAIVYVGRATDTLRDEPDSAIPPWWKTARKLRARMAQLSDDTARNQDLKEKYPDFDGTDVSRYDDLASKALAGEPVEAADVNATCFGLALRKPDWKPVRASFSLSRTQMALWFTFAVATGLFLWLLYGDLRRIDGSLLVLLGISIGTAGLSWITDRNAPSGRGYVPSRGFWYDLLTGFDERKQLHRYQAVVVNVLLLVVQQQLSYPVFDPTWLIFLGISGTAYGVGKQVLESR